MKIEQIKQRVSNGFKPFELRLSDGRRLAVPHPEFLAIGQRVVVVIGKDDRVTTIDPVHIVSIEEKGQNGRRGR